MEIQGHKHGPMCNCRQRAKTATVATVFVTLGDKSREKKNIGDWGPSRRTAGPIHWLHRISIFSVKHQ